MSRLSPFNLFLIALWWPLPLIPGFRWEDTAALLVFSIFACVLRGIAAIAPKNANYQWQNLRDDQKAPFKSVVVALIALEALLLIYLRVFGAGHEGVSARAAILGPAADTVIHVLPKFRLMAADLVEMGVGQRVDFIVVAWALVYAGQIPIALLWVPALLRRFRYAPLPEGLFSLKHFPRFCIWFCVITLLWFALYYPEVKDARGRKDLFFDFERRDVDLFYRTLLHSFVFWQIPIFLVLGLIPLRRRRRELTAVSGFAK